MIFDFHVHLFSEDVRRSRSNYFSDRNFKLLYEDSGSKIMDAHGVAGYLDDNNITKSAAMGFAWENPDYCLKQNEYFSETAKEFKGRIYPFGTIPKGIKNVHEWCVSIKESGLFGVGELAFYSGGVSSADFDFLSSVLNSSSELSLPVCLHVNEPLGHIYAGKYQTSFSELFKIISDYPDAKIILSHWGGGLLFYELMPEVKEKLKNCFYDTAASPYLYEDKIYRSAADITGPDKILFGSDFPLLGIKRYMKGIDENLNSEERDLVLWANAVRILGLEK